MFGIRDYYRDGERPHYKAPLWTTYTQANNSLYAPGYEEEPIKRHAVADERDLRDDVDTITGDVKPDRMPYNLTTPISEPRTGRANDPTIDVQKLSAENNTLRTDNDKLKTENNELQVQIDSLKKALADKMNDFNQERSDFQSYRSRVADAEAKAVVDGKIKLLSSLLPAIDDLERIQSNEDLPDTVVKALAKLKAALESSGAVEYGEKGDEFDPSLHSAVLMTGDANDEHELVSEVISHGWTMDDRQVRPAQVVVTGGDSDGRE